MELAVSRYELHMKIMEKRSAVQRDSDCEPCESDDGNKGKW